MFINLFQKHKNAKGLWGVPFPFLDELEKIFGADRANGNNCEDFPEALEDTQHETVNLDHGGEDHTDEEDESVHSTQPSPQLGKRSRKEKLSMDKAKKKMAGVVNLTSSFSNVSSNLCGFMEGMNSHLSSIASALATTQQHEQVLMAREIELDEQKKNLFNEVINIPGLTRIEAMIAARKLASDTSSLSIFYQCPDDEWKKDFVLNLIHPDLPSSFTL